MREMKDSGIEWIGQIPKEWKIQHLKYICSLKVGGTPKNKEGINNNGYGYPWITAQDIDENMTINSSKQFICEESIKKSGYTLFPTGSVLLVCIASVGKVGIIEKKAYANQQITALIPKSNRMHSKYLLYIINAASFKIVFDASSNVVPIVNTKYLQNFNIVSPNINEQKKIADFLDKKCAEIDILTSDIQKQIDTLEQYKKSVITEAVTKGLKLDAEMKDSGVDWIGDIPSDWETIKIGRLFSIRNERNTKSMDEVQLLSLYTGIGVFPHGEQEERGNKAVTVEGYKIVHKNDIVVNIILAWMGAIGISEYDGVTSPAYDIYVPDTRRVSPHFYHYVFRTKGIAGECYKYGRGIMLMRWRTYAQEFKQISVPFPSIEIQQEIAEYLDKKCSEIDTIISDKKKQLEVIAEYKKSLIYEYVTGKKEVM